MHSLMYIRDDVRTFCEHIGGFLGINVIGKYILHLLSLFVPSVF